MVEHVPSEYHAYWYGVVPPDGLAVSVIDCPLSIAGLEGMIAPAESAGLMVTKSAGDVALTVGVPVELSVTV